MGPLGYFLHDLKSPTTKLEDKISLENHTLRDLISILQSDNSEKALDIIKANPSLLREKCSIWLEPRKTAINFIVDKIYDGEFSLFKRYDNSKWIHLLIKIFEIDPEINLDESEISAKHPLPKLLDALMRNYVNVDNFSEGWQLISYLSLCRTPFSNFNLDQLDGPCTSLFNMGREIYEKAFLAGIEICKMDQVNAHPLSSLLTEVNGTKVLEVMYAKCPWLANFPTEFINKKFQEYLLQIG